MQCLPHQQQPEGLPVIVTTSRDPSPGTRRFARALASFLSLSYVNRGKSGMGGGEEEEAEAALVVVEDHGNPSGIVKRFCGGEDRLSFRLSGELQAGRMKAREAVICGEEEACRPIASLFDLKWQGDSAPFSATEKDAKREARVIVVAPGCIDFIDNGDIRFRLKT